MLVAPARFHSSAGCEHRHEHLLAADRVHLLADDLRGAWCTRQPAGSQLHRPGADLADEAGAHHQLVRERLGVGGRLALGGQEVAVGERVIDGEQ